MGRPDGPALTGVDLENANAARIYDYFLGGGHNFPVDREAAARIAEAIPEAPIIAQANRAFLAKAVRWCVSEGIDQFLDLGSGVPTAGNVHEIALELDPAARVAYVDFEPVAVAHAEEITSELGTVSVTRADIRDPDSVLGAQGVAELLDFARPVAVLAVTVLHFVDGDAAGLLARYRAALVPGSAVVISHSSDDHDDPELARRVHDGAAVYDGSATPETLRSRAGLRSLLAGLDLVPPGLVDLHDWLEAGSTRTGTGMYCAVGRLT